MLLCYAEIKLLMIVLTGKLHPFKNVMSNNIRKKLYSFLLRMKQPDGSFVMHEGGEVDVRFSKIYLVIYSSTVEVPIAHYR